MYSARHPVAAVRAGEDGPAGGSRPAGRPPRLGSSHAAFHVQRVIAERTIEARPRGRDGAALWCDPPGFDRWARRQLRWRDPGAADDASDVLLVGATVGSAAAVAWLAASEGDRRDVLEDVFLVAAAVAVTDALTRGVQHASGRLRPQGWDAGAPRVDRERRAFFSGHSSRAFAAAAATQVSRLRGRRASGWVTGRPARVACQARAGKTRIVRGRFGAATATPRALA